jgi:acyl carrier protein
MEKLNSIIASVLKLSPEKASENLSMNDVAAWDSLSHMGLIVAIEDEFKIEMSGDDIAEMTSFDAIRRIVVKYVN